MPGTQLLMTFPVTATSHSLAEYRARGGYVALEKTLKQMKPQDVTKEVTASGLQGRGAAELEQRAVFDTGGAGALAGATAEAELHLLGNEPGEGDTSLGHSP